MIKFINVTKIYHPDTTVFQDVSFGIKAGEFVSIVGKSGAGKTTLVHLILGLEMPTFGQVHFKGLNLSEADSPKIQEIRRKIGVIHQDYKLLPKKTVYENVAYIMEVEGKDNEEIEKEVPKVLEVIGLGGRLIVFPINFPEEKDKGWQLLGLL